MHKNRSPCPLSLLPPGLVLLRESAVPTPPSRLTPELIREQGNVKTGETFAHVALHEQAVRIGVPELIREAVDGGEDIVRFKADIAVCDVINRNMRYYPRSAYEGANTRAAKALAEGKLTMLLEHPDWDEPWKGKLTNVAGVWEELGIEDREIEWPPESGQLVTKPVVFGSGRMIGTTAGKELQALFAGKAYVGISTNAYSSVEYTRAGDLDPNFFDPEWLIPVTGDDLVYLTIDAVSDPSNLGGQATAESAQHPPTPPTVPPAPPAQESGEETVMHPKIKALLERLKKTLDQVKAEHAPEYLQALEEIAVEQNTLHESAALVPGLQANVTRLEGELGTANTALEAERQARRSEGHARLVDDAIAAAALPELPPYLEGTTTVDLAAEFRAELLTEAQAAETDEAATVLIERRLNRRQHMLAGLGQGQESVNTPAPRTGGPKLPQGDNDAGEPLRATESASANPLLAALR